MAIHFFDNFQLNRSKEIPRMVFVCLMLLLGACGSSRPTSDTGKHDRLVGYVHGGSEEVDVRPVDAQRLTHINYAFANVRPEGTVVLEQPQDSVYLRHLDALRDASNPDLKLLLSIGGWGWSDHFSDAARTKEARERFAKSAVSLLRTYDLDGLDIDWEYPGQPGQGNTYRAADQENFTRLLKTLRAHLDAAEDRADRMDHYLLTIAAGASTDYLAHTDMQEVQRMLDFVNLMTYDFHNSATPRTGHHANLYASVDSIPSAAASVKHFLDAGVPARKLVLGVPFYGRSWSGVREQKKGRRQPYAKYRNSYSYGQLISNYIDQRGYTHYWDETAQVPYLWNPDSSVFISYADTVSVARKVQFVQRHNLGGVMFWEYHEDASGLLLQTLSEHLR